VLKYEIQTKKIEGREGESDKDEGKERGVNALIRADLRGL
jgi:hypothetical protein